MTDQNKSCSEGYWSMTIEWEEDTEPICLTALLLGDLESVAKKYINWSKLTFEFVRFSDLTKS